MTRLNPSPKNRLILILILAPILTTFALPATADETTAPEPTTIRLGLGAIYLPDFEGAKDSSAYALPLLEIRNWHRFDLTIRGLSYRLYTYKNDATDPFRKLEFRFEPALSPSTRREEDIQFLFYSSGKNKYLRGLGDIDTGLDLGTNLFLRTGPIATRLNLRQEVAGGHGGFTAELGLGTRIPLAPNTSLAIEATTTYANDTYMDAFFSINHKQARRSIYHPYQASAGFKNAGAALSLLHDFNNHLALFAITSYSHLLGDAADSPLIKGPGGTQDQFTALIGLTYTWTLNN
mgnify:CR=1 FL=1